MNEVASPPLNIRASLKVPFIWALAAGFCAGAISLFLPNYYRSEARLLPIETKSASGSLGGIASAAAALGVNIPGGDGSDANFVEILNSRSIKEQLLRVEYHFHEKSWRFGADNARTQGLGDYIGGSNIEQSLRAFDSIYSATRDAKTRLIAISAETRSPELSKSIVDQAVQQLEHHVRDKNRSRGGAKASFAEARLEEAMREMNEAEEVLRRFLDGNRNYSTSQDPSVRLKGGRLESDFRLKQQLISTLTLNREQALLEEKNDIPIVNVLDPANLPIAKSRPSRSNIILFTSLLTAVAAWLWLNRSWLQSRLTFEQEDPQMTNSEQV